MEKFRVENEKVYVKGVEMAWINCYITLVIGLGMNGSNAVVIWYGAKLHQNGEISVGAISSFLLYMMQLVIAFIVVSYGFGNLYKLTGAAEKIIQMMRFVPRVNTRGGIKLDDEQIETDGSIEFKNVSFSYPTKSDV